jgi:hypothetical protein
MVKLINFGVIVFNISYLMCIDYLYWIVGAIMLNCGLLECGYPSNSLLIVRHFYPT